MRTELEGEGDTGAGGSRIFRFLGDELDPDIGSPSKKPRLTGFKASTSSTGNQTHPPCPPPTSRGGQPTCPPGDNSDVDGQKWGLQPTEAARKAWRRTCSKGREDSCWGREDGTVRSRRTGSMGTQWGWGPDHSSLGSSSDKLLPNTHSIKNIPYLSENILNKRGTSVYKNSPN